MCEFKVLQVYYDHLLGWINNITGLRLWSLANKLLMVRNIMLLSVYPLQAQNSPWPGLFHSQLSFCWQGNMFWYCREVDKLKMLFCGQVVFFVPEFWPYLRLGNFLSIKCFDLCGLHQCNRSLWVMIHQWIIKSFFFF